MQELSRGLCPSLREHSAGLHGWQLDPEEWSSYRMLDVKQEEEALGNPEGWAPEKMWDTCLENSQKSLGTILKKANISQLGQGKLMPS